MLCRLHRNILTAREEGADLVYVNLIVTDIRRHQQQAYNPREVPALAVSCLVEFKCYGQAHFWMIEEVVAYEYVALLSVLPDSVF